MRAFEACDLAWAHALNQAHAEALADTPADAFRVLVERATVARIVAPASGFVLAFATPPSAAHPNYDWLIARYPRLLYVDRIVVDPACRRRSVARRLYTETFAVAQKLGLRYIGCEVNQHPPNPGSDAFHAAMGFSPCGAQYLADRDKTVRYLVRDLEAGSSARGAEQ